MRREYHGRGLMDFALWAGVSFHNSLNLLSLILCRKPSSLIKPIALKAHNRAGMGMQILSIANHCIVRLCSDKGGLFVRGIRRRQGATVDEGFSATLGDDS